MKFIALFILGFTLAMTALWGGSFLCFKAQGDWYAAPAYCTAYLLFIAGIALCVISAFKIVGGKQ